MRFEFATVDRIIFGWGTRRELASIARSHGRRALVLTGNSPERSESILTSCRAEGLELVFLRVSSEPTVALVQAGAVQARAERSEMVIAIGGGSVLDAGKAVAVLATNPRDILDYLEVVGQARLWR
jgi:alcohol dehydrogenase class IV